MKIDKQNGEVCFNEEYHKYWNTKDDRKYVSVTTLIEKFGQPFDKDFWSAYKALEKLIPADDWKIEKKSLLNTHKFDSEILSIYNISELDFNKAQQGVLDEWMKTNIESCERGTKIHAELENSFYSAGNNVSLKRFGIGGKFICDKGRTNLDLENGVYPEYLISVSSKDGYLNLAGQIDLLVKNGNHITIMDWKGLPLDTPIGTPKGWTTMKDLQEGDKVFDKDGNIVTVLHKSSIHHNPCYKITFDNSETITADKDHRWLISFKDKNNSYIEKVMTTEELSHYLDSIKDNINEYSIPKIQNAKPLNLEDANLPLDPYVLGCWLGDGSNQCEVITNNNSDIWNEIICRGYQIGDNIASENECEAHNVLDIYPILKSLNLINNKHIPNIYLRGSYKQRLDLLRGLMDTNGYYYLNGKEFVMATDQEWQQEAMLMLLGSLGIKPLVSVIGYEGWYIHFSTNGLNPFLVKNQDIEFSINDKNSFRNIVFVEAVGTVPTQCIEVDSPTHTYLAGHTMIVTHNTNKEIKQHSGFDTKTRSTTKMKYPLNKLEDCNFYHYTLQLSTYAWMLQQLHPEFVIDDLILVHFDHKGKQTVYHLDYLKTEVQKMLLWHKKQLKHQDEESKYKRIEY
jgi:hypothetical protein